MKIKGFCLILFGLTFSSCNQNPEPIAEKENQSETSTAILEASASDISSEKEEIQRLVREVLKWAESKNSIDLLPVVADKNDSIYSNFDLSRLKQNLNQLEETNLFAKEFIENYNQIILKLNRKLAANEFEYGPWLVGDMPPFSFESDVDPWCLCQDSPAPWDQVEVNHLEGQTYEWKWGDLKEETHPSWKEFRYKFKVTKENTRWVISYLEGFDIEQIKE
jgi:hypothetical protein